ncbi:MAG: PAS domain-containing protein [Chloroflexia bacterium]|nr:PAS domain-containing protein [Chloroflexia bacterium]
MAGPLAPEAAGPAADRPATGLADGAYRALFERSPDAIVVVAADGTVVDANRAACALLGYRRDEMLALRRADIFTTLLAGAAGPDGDRSELRRKDGTLLWTAVRTVDLPGSDGPLVALVLTEAAAGAAGAATQRNSSGSESAIGARDYQALVEYLPAVAYRELVHPTGASSRSYMSPQIATLTETTAAEWETEPNLWEGFLHPADRDRVLAEDARANLSGDSFASDYRLLTRSGREVWVRDRSTRIEIRPDGVQVWQGVILDISEEKRVQEAHRQAEARFRALVQNAADIISIVDGDGIQRFVSPSIERVLGYAPAEWLEFPIESHLAPDDLDRFRQLLAEAAASPGTPVCTELRARHKDGSWQWLETTATDLLDDADIGGIVFNARDMTERRQAEQALQKAEGRAQAFLDQLPVLVFVQPVANPHQAAYVNPWTEAIFGLDPATWTATWQERVHPDDRAVLQAEVARTDDTGEPFCLEYRERTADGRYLWVRDEAVLVRDAAGQPDYWIGAKIDVTDRRQAADAVRASEALYRSLVEHLPAAVYVDAADRLGVPIYASPRIATLLGYDHHQWQADPSLGESRLHPDDRERVLAEHAHATATGEPLLTEFRYLARDGRAVWVRDEAVLVRDEEGRPHRWYGVVLDITQRRQAEEQLRETEARYRTLVEQLPAVVSIHAPDAFGSTLYVSPQFERVFGYTAAEVAANPRLWHERTHPDDIGRILAEMARAAAGSGRMRLEYRQRTRDGRWLWQRDESVLLRDADGAPLYWQTVLTDITDIKLAQEVAEAANALKSTFLSSMSHELRTPLNAITGYTHLLLDGYEGDVPAAQRTAIEIIAGAADHLLALIDDVLDLSKIEAEALELSPQRLDLASVVEDVRTALVAQAAAKALVLTVDVAPGLTVEADPRRFRQILLNLVANAVKFTERGEVRIAARPVAAGVEVVVADTGLGIAPAFLPYVFDEFRQADPSPTRRHGGSGLGLAIVRRLVDLHGGTIAVESEPGVGTTFVVTLPAVQDSSQPDALRSA